MPNFNIYIYVLDSFFSFCMPSFSISNFFIHNHTIFTFINSQFSLSYHLIPMEMTLIGLQLWALKFLHVKYSIWEQKACGNIWQSQHSMTKGLLLSKTFSMWKKSSMPILLNICTTFFGNKHGFFREMKTLNMFSFIIVFSLEIAWFFWNQEKQYFGVS